MKQRIISMILVFCILISLLPMELFAAEIDKLSQNTQKTVNPFSDVDKTDWYYNSVIYAYENGIFSGTSNDTFSPNGTMTRGMYMTVMGRIAEIDTKDYIKTPEFTDVSPSSYYAPYVQWAVEKGITFGIEENLFGPDDFVTRQQMATLSVRFFDAYGIPYPNTINTTIPKDIDLVADWAKDSVMKLWACGLFLGDNGGKFNPKSNAKRSEAAMIAFRTEQIVEQWFIDTGVKPDPNKDKETTPIPEKTPDKDGNGGSSGGNGNGGNEGGNEGSNEEGKTYSVTFKDGDKKMDTLSTIKNKPLASLPTPDKTAKANAIFIGWFTDSGLTTPFYLDNPVKQDMTVYAKYADMPGEDLTPRSFALLDQDPNLSFEVIKTSEAIVSLGDAFTLIPKDGSDPVSLKWTSNGDLYTVMADGGFNKGCSYELTLADGYNFKDKASTIRTASFTIKMEKVANLKMNNDIKYIQDTESIDYDIDGKIYEVLTPSLISENGGKFDYEGANSLDKGDILCFYITTSPEDRDYINESYNKDPEVYAKVESISGTTVIFGAMNEDDMNSLYKVPDNLPILVDQLPTTEEGIVNIDKLDTGTYALIMGEEVTIHTAINKAKEQINVGDFVSLYVSADSVTEDGEDAVYFGEVTEYNSSTGEISYKQTNAQAIEDSMDLYITPEVDGDDLITEQEKAAMESQILSQVQESNFAQDAAFMLADMSTKTNGFRNLDSVQSIFFKDENGNILSDGEVALLNLGTSFEPTDDIKLTVEIVTSGDQLHFDGGVQLAIGIDATFEVETKDGGKIVISLSAVFVEEVALGVNVKGDLVWKKVLGFIPIPIGVTVSAAMDIKNFTAITFNINIYTVAAEEESTWEKVKGLLADTKAGEILDQIEEVQNKIDQAKGTAEQIKVYTQDLEDLWNNMPKDKTSKEEWAELGKTLGKTNISKDLMDMMNLSTETNLKSGAYAESMQDLMEKYSEMLQRETDWVKLADEQMFGFFMCFYGITIDAHVNFVVRADINIAMATNLEYEVGKRYTFWFKIGLFKPKAGSETMDLIDERFAFQFYVMGKLGLKMGAAVTIEVGLAKIASIGITAELGPYVKLYGFFIYEYEKMKPANTNSWIYEERMAGALYLEFGLYFILTFNASALGKLFEYSYDFFNIEIPLLQAGEKRYKYAFAYEPQVDEQVRITDEDNNSSNGITMDLPDSLRALSYVDLNTGILGSEPYEYEKYNITFSNPNFSIDENGKVSVNVAKGVQYMESDITLTWLHGKLAFSKFDMSVTIPLVWTNLSTAELNEYFTASVRVGNVQDGYQTIWSKRVKKNQEFDLPTIDAVKKSIKYADYDDGQGKNMKYESISDYEGQQTKNLKIYDDTVYSIEAKIKDYDITVTGIEQENGSSISKTYSAKYGQTFDFTDLVNTGTNNLDREEFTKFAELTAEKAKGDIGKGEISTYDLAAPIEGKYALAIADGKVNPVASYVDDSVIASFQFDGIEHDDVSQKLKKGTSPDLGRIEEIVEVYGLGIKDIYPTFGKLFTNIIYTVVCEELPGSDFTIYFETNGGSSVDAITKVEDSIIGVLPTPIRKGYTFEGWYTDEELSLAFDLLKMPSENITLYGKWTANTYKVTLNPKGGTFDNDISQKIIHVTYGKTYGELEAPANSGKSFIGWFTESDDGTMVNSDTIVDKINDHDLYAHWTDKQVIRDDIFSFTLVTSTYEKNTVVSAVYEKDPTYKELGGFTFEYRKQGEPDATIITPINAGTYDMVAKRVTDAVYEKFDYRYPAVVVINKATRALDSVNLEENNRGYTFLDLKPAYDAIDDLSDKASFTYIAEESGSNEMISSNPGDSYIGGLLPDTGYSITVKVTDDPNYQDAESTQGVTIRTLAAPTTSWADYTEEFTVEDNQVTISSPGELAYLAEQVNGGNNYNGITITLLNDIDLTGHKWVPIGVDYNAFSGIFDGGGHTISGLYVNGENYGGLFGIVSNSTIKNIRLEDSYVEGNSYVGGIVGAFSDFMSSMESLLLDCVNGATIVGRTEFVGGIVGRVSIIWGKSLVINNCLNYGRIIGKDSTGGIAGYQSNSIIMNSVNFGSVTGNTNVGGILGMNNNNSDSQLLNCYTIGTVKGTGKYVGAVIGRNEKDKGKVLQGYYLYGSATCNGTIRNAVGTQKGSLADGAEKTQTASFTSIESNLSRDCGYGTDNLIDVLNAWVDKNNQGATWIEGSNGYPIPRSIMER